MKELSKTDNLLNEYIINNSEISSTNEHLLTQQSFNNNLNIKLQSKRNSLKIGLLEIFIDSFHFCSFLQIFVFISAHLPIFCTEPP